MLLYRQPVNFLPEPLNYGGWMPNLSGLLKKIFWPTVGQTSFRRILLSRILLLSVPVLLLGEYVTYRKARSGLLETARQNLSESAQRKAERIQDSIKSLSAGLLTATQTTALQSGSPEISKKFLEQLAQQLPTPIQCVQLANPVTGKAVVSTCGDKSLGVFGPSVWPAKFVNATEPATYVKVTAVLPEKSSPTDSQNNISGESKLSLVLSAPVYDAQTGELRYALKIQSALLAPESDKPRSLSGYTVVIREDGTILNHPNASRVGRNITEEQDAARLRSIMTTALSGKTDFGHLFGFERKGVELLAGYTALSIPLSNTESQRWVILAVTRLDNALAGLEEIQHVLVTLILGLLGANLIATLYLSKDLARPLEKLGFYAMAVQARGTFERIPHNFRIREFNQLAEALDSMVERLLAWADELETAWKEAKVASELKNEFLANTSHELRTPLNAIIGCIRLVRDGCCDDEEEETEFLQRADDAAIHLLDIINDVLDIAKIEAGTLSVVMEPMDLNKVLQEAIYLQQSQIQQKNLELVWQLCSETVTVEADPAKLKQVFLNVVGNAIKFTDAGSIKVSVQIEPAHLPNQIHESNVVVKIQDTGIGVDPTQQHRLFQPFVMVDGTRTRRYGGTGLGLAISRNLIELMKGKISLSSDGPGHGTTVEIKLPLVDLKPLNSLSHADSKPALESTNIVGE